MPTGPLSLLDRHGLHGRGWETGSPEVLRVLSRCLATTPVNCLESQPIRTGRGCKPLSCHPLDERQSGAYRGAVTCPLLPPSIPQLPPTPALPAPESLEGRIPPCSSQDPQGLAQSGSSEASLNEQMNE